MTSYKNAGGTWPLRKSRSTPSNIGTMRREPQKYRSPNPITASSFEQLLSLESESTETWRKKCDTKRVTAWKKTPLDKNEPPIYKTILRCDGVPYNKAVKYMSDWRKRSQWDTTFDVVDILEELKIGNFKVPYCRVKNQELVMASVERTDLIQHCHIQAMCSIRHPKVPEVVKKGFKRAEVFLFGIIIRPIDDGSETSQMTVIYQIDFSGAKSPLKHRLRNIPKNIKKYHLAHQDDYDDESSTGSLEKRRLPSTASSSGSPERMPQYYKKSQSVNDIIV